MLADPVADIRDMIRNSGNIGFPSLGFRRRESGIKATAHQLGQSISECQKCKLT